MEEETTVLHNPNTHSLSKMIIEIEDNSEMTIGGISTEDTPNFP